VYEKDRVDPVEPGARLVLDPDRLARFPAGYRHLAYLQSMAGIDVATNLPGSAGPELEDLYRAGRAWLAGDALRR
jgi:hypothetical protein